MTVTLPPPSHPVAAESGRLTEPWYRVFSDIAAHDRLTIRRLTEGTFAASTSVPIVLTAFTGYRAIKFVITNFTTSADATIGLLIRTSSDAGSTFDNGGSDYGWANVFVVASGSVTQLNDTADSEMDVNVYPGNAAGETGSIEITLYHQAGTSQTLLRWEGSYLTDAPNIVTTSGSGVRFSNAAVNAIQFLPTSGTMSGSYAVYGIP